jgi:hypothetical protein
MNAEAHPAPEALEKRRTDFARKHHRDEDGIALARSHHDVPEPTVLRGCFRRLPLILDRSGSMPGRDPPGTARCLTATLELALVEDLWNLDHHLGYDV